MTTRQEKPSDYFKDKLAPLVSGLSVKFVLEYRKKHGTKFREVKIMVLLAPGLLYGLSPETVVISLVGKGSCIVFPELGKGVASMVAAGIPVRLANALFEKLTELYGEKTW